MCALFEIKTEATRKIPIMNKYEVSFRILELASTIESIYFESTTFLRCIMSYQCVLSQAFLGDNFDAVSVSEEIFSLFTMCSGTLFCAVLFSNMALVFANADITAAKVTPT